VLHPVFIQGVVDGRYYSEVVGSLAESREEQAVIEMDIPDAGDAEASDDSDGDLRVAWVLVLQGRGISLVPRPCAEGSIRAMTVVCGGGCQHAAALGDRSIVRLDVRWCECVLFTVRGAR
jgi:hypothetical protein